MTNHERFMAAFKGKGGQTFSTSKIGKIMLNKFPNMNLGSILPNDHASKDHKSPCWCASTPSRIFDRKSRGLYVVNPSL